MKTVFRFARVQLGVNRVNQETEIMGEMTLDDSDIFKKNK